MFFVKTSFQMIVVRFLLMCLLLIALSHPAIAASDGACAGATPLELNGSLPGYGSGGTDFFELDVTSTGYLVVEAVAPLDAAAEPKIALFDKDCRLADPTGKSSTVIDAFVAGLVLEVRKPGIYQFGVAAQDPQLTVGEYKVVTGFVSHADLGLPPRTKDVAEPEPDPDPLGNKDVAEPEPDPDPLGNKALCEPSTVDDHSDSFLCATTLIPGSSLRGDVRNRWNDDRDLFSFVLNDWQTVKIEILGDVHTFGALYDTHGHRLRVYNGGGGAGLLIVKTLAPGQYFVGVEGAYGAEGEFTLRLSPLAW